MLSIIFKGDNKTGFYYNQKSLLDLLEVICQEEKIAACLPLIAAQKAYFSKRQGDYIGQLKRYKEIDALVKSGEEPIKSYAICLFFFLDAAVNEKELRSLLKKAPIAECAPLAYLKFLKSFDSVSGGVRDGLLLVTYDGESEEQRKVRVAAEQKHAEDNLRFMQVQTQTQAMPDLISSAKTFLPAQLKLAMTYETGLKDVVEQNLALACELYEKALKHPHLAMYRETIVTEEAPPAAPLTEAEIDAGDFFLSEDEIEKTITVQIIENDIKKKIAMLKEKLQIASLAILPSEASASNRGVFTHRVVSENSSANTSKSISPAPKNQMELK